MRPNACFLTFLRGMKKRNQVVIDLASDDVVDALRCQIPGVPLGSSLTVAPKEDVFVYDDYDGELYRWGKECTKSNLTPEQRTNLTRELFRAALGFDGGEWYYSFCRKSWRQDNCTRHCSVCRECMDWR